MKTYYLTLGILLSVFSGCEALNDTVEAPTTASESNPVTYVYNMNHPGVDNISMADLNRLKAENLASLMDIVESVKVEKSRRPERVDELYIHDDELTDFESKLNELSGSFEDTPLLPVYKQQIGLHVIDQFLRVPDGAQYTKQRTEMIARLAKELLDWESHDVRVLAHALLVLENTWETDELVNGINYVESVVRESGASSKAHGLVNSALPEHIQVAQRKQLEETEAVLRELSMVKQSLIERG